MFLNKLCGVLLVFACLAQTILGDLNIVPRSEWKAKPALHDMTPLELPVGRIIIAHTAGKECNTKAECVQELQGIQNFHQKIGFDDISYNYLIGNDGNVYEGRGDSSQGALANGSNVGSIGIGFMGTFLKDLPSQPALEAAKSLLEKLKNDKKLEEDYKLCGHHHTVEAVFRAQDNVGGGTILRIVPRDGWLAQPPLNPWIKLDLPVNRVIVIPTRTSNCETQAACTYTVRLTQTFNIESQRQDDIIYNFMIGGDGNVYEGRGWENRGSAVIGFNDDSISLAFIGSFNRNKPSDKQMNVTKLLLNEGVRLGKLSKDYRIVAANKLDPASTANSADALYRSFENWPHWSDH